MPTIQGMGIETTLPQLTLLPRGLFTQVVPQIDLTQEGADRTAFGAKYMTRGALAPHVDDFGCDTDDETTDEVTLDEREQLPFVFWDSMTCSTVAIEPDYLLDWLNADKNLTLSAALTLAATTQITADHLNLADDSTTVTASTGVTAGIGNIEAGLAGVIGNAKGYIFVSPTLIAPAVAAGAVLVRDNRFESPRGHDVIADAGHGAENTIYGTGSMAWSVVDDSFGDPLQFSRAQNRYRAEFRRYGLVLLNPAHSVKTVVS